VRTFIAVDTDPDIRQTLGRAVGELRSLAPGVKWSDPAAMHITLRFLGEVPDRDLPAVIAAAREAARGAGPLTLALGAPASFGGAEPRVLFLGIEGETAALSALRAALEDRLAARGFGREARAFSPHLTLGRPKKGPVPPSWRDFTPAGVKEWTVEELTVYASTLTPAGPVYTALARCALGDEGAPPAAETADNR
jgi:2'-5' RNA ligase